MSRAWSLALPVVTVLVVTYSVLIAGAPRKLVAARVYGGPTEGAQRLSLRIQVVERDGERESPIWTGPVSVRFDARGTREVTAVAAVATHGVAEIVVPFAMPLAGPVTLHVGERSGRQLAYGSIRLDATRWALRARRRGGWIHGRAQGTLAVSIAEARGAAVIGAADPVLIRVERAGAPASGVSLVVHADGGRVIAEEPLRTDARGRAQVSFEPTELNPTLRVEARSNVGESALIDSPLPLVPGGFHVQASGGAFRIEAAVPRSEAFVSVVTDRERVAGAVLELAPDARGGSAGTVHVPDLPRPAWLVVSSDVDQNSPAAIGWPLDLGSEPAQTFDVADALLLDGMPSAFAREQLRRSRVRWLSAAFIGIALLLSVVLLVVRVRAADRHIQTHLRDELEPETAARVAPQRRLSLLVALLTLSLGFVMLALVMLGRMH